MIDSDISFITNEGDVTLSKRFERLLKQTKFFDCLVGYFYTSGFHNMYKSLEDVSKIRILVGIKTDQATFDLIQEGAAKTAGPREVILSVYLSGDKDG